MFVLVNGRETIYPEINNLKQSESPNLFQLKSNKYTWNYDLKNQNLDSTCNRVESAQS